MMLGLGLGAVGCERPSDEMSTGSRPAPSPAAQASTVDARVIAQNDAWGRWQQLRQAGAPESEQQVAARRVMELALPRGSLPLCDGSIPAAVLTTLGTGPYVERGTELAVLGHEWSHGMRRLFRVLDTPDTDAILFSQLVALDTEGRAHLTSIVGEIEVLRRSAHLGDIVSAEVYELDRDDLGLHPIETVAHIPAEEGANHFIAVFDPPEPLADLPCLRCHEDDHISGRPSLPTNDDPQVRRAELLRGHPALSTAAGELDIGLERLLDSAR